MDGDIQRDYDEESTSSSRRSASLARRICAYFSQLGKWEVWKAIILGQFLSLLLCGTGVTSQLLHSTYMVRVPTGKSLFFLNYYNESSSGSYVYSLKIILTFCKNIKD
ncbi:solute carrier family 35 member F2-like [Centruroides sculpturatus]|uniref:solute carrier family 35 member F2-like n=1 Tax=Centruroides sculpturatus TaxID=218467 RepID=UPI000C6CBC55|nr:solute carrier family 35 member F2-like [Centruroides sculpturatus]